MTTNEPKHTPTPFVQHSPNCGWLIEWGLCGFTSLMPDEATARRCAASSELLAACKAMESRLTAAARAFYVDGKASALRAAFDGWKADVEPARAAIQKAEGAA